MFFKWNIFWIISKNKSYCTRNTRVIKFNSDRVIQKNKKVDIKNMTD
jgi:hypothetical protein